MRWLLLSAILATQLTEPAQAREACARPSPCRPVPVRQGERRDEKKPFVSEWCSGEHEQKEPDHEPHRHVPFSAYGK